MTDVSGVLRRIGDLARNNGELVVFGILLESSLIIFLTVTGLERGSYLLEIFFWLPFTVYLLIIWMISKKASKIEEATARKQISQISLVILLFAIIFHATLLCSPSPLSNDIYSYYWDGKVINNGINPYTYSADADQLSSLRDSNWESILNKHVPTVYPPLSQGVFAAAYFIFPSTFTLRLCSVLFNLLSIWVIILILKKLNLDVRYSIIYAWSPLATIEFTNSGHIDSLAVLLVLSSFLLLLKRRMVLSSAAMALAVLAKVYPLLFIGPFLLRWGKKGALIFAGVIAMFYLPFLSAVEAQFHGLSYFARWGLFNGSLFPLLLAGLGTIMGKGESLLVSKALVLLIFACLLIYLTYRYSQTLQQEENDMLLWKYSFWLIGAFLLLSPTVHPWYLTWVLPFLCFFRSAGWILLTGTVILARSVYIGYEATGVWKEIWWIRLCEYGPFYLLLFREMSDRIKKEKNWSVLGLGEPEKL